MGEGAYSKLEMSGPGRSVPGSRSDAGGRSANHSIRRDQKGQGSL